MHENSFPLVTIGIPTYNRANSYLTPALASALAQTYPNLEIVVSDNCSTDNTEAVVNSFSDPRIRYFKQAKNIIPNDNFNFCLAQARGAFFLMLHDDDLIDGDFIQVCMKAAKDRLEAGVIRTGMRRIDSQGKVTSETLNQVGGLSTEDFFMGWFSGKTPMHFCCTLFNTARLKEMGGFNSKHQLFQDVLAHVQLAALFGRVDIPDVKASFRQHTSQNTVAVKINSWCEDSLQLLETMARLIPAEKRTTVRGAGIRFFAGHNYRLASKIKSPVERFRTYWRIYRMFEYQYSPVHFFASQALRRMRRTRHKVRQEVLSVAQKLNFLA